MYLLLCLWMCAWFRVRVQMWISRVAVKEQLYDIASSPSCGFSVTLRIDGRSNQKGETPVWGPKMTLSMASIRNKDNQTPENSLESEGMSFIVAIERTMRYSTGVSWTPVAMMASYGYTRNNKTTTKISTQHSSESPRKNRAWNRYNKSRERI